MDVRETKDCHYVIEKDEYFESMRIPEYIRPLSECYLCEAFSVEREQHCENCINWNPENNAKKLTCSSEKSPYSKWSDLAKYDYEIAITVTEEILSVLKRELEKISTNK